jgi:hypothetical protein
MSEATSGIFSKSAYRYAHAGYLLHEWRLSVVFPCADEAVAPDAPVPIPPAVADAKANCAASPTERKIEFYLYDG